MLAIPHIPNSAKNSLHTSKIANFVLAARSNAEFMKTFHLLSSCAKSFLQMVGKIGLLNELLNGVSWDNSLAVTASIAG
jgi:hypothetical protein